MHEFSTDDPEPLPAEEPFSLLRQTASQETIHRIAESAYRLTADDAIQHLTNKSKTLLSGEGGLMTVRSYAHYEGSRLPEEIKAELQAKSPLVGMLLRTNDGEDVRAEEYSVRSLGNSCLQLVQHFYSSAEMELTIELTEAEAQALLAQLVPRDRSK